MAVSITIGVGTMTAVPAVSQQENTELARTLEFQAAVLHLAARSPECRCSICILVPFD
jgi:hypothetical protein